MTWQRSDWNARVVEHLVMLKRQGLGFDDAWLMAMRAHPPRGRDCGPERPTLLDDPRESESLVAFHRRACSDAWFGRRPELKHFHPSLLIDRDGSEIRPKQRRLAA